MAAKSFWGRRPAAKKLRFPQSNSGNVLVVRHRVRAPPLLSRQATVAFGTIKAAFVCFRFFPQKVSAFLPMSAADQSEGKFKDIDNKISKLLSVKGRFTKDFQSTARSQPRAAFLLVDLKPEDAKQLKESLKELVEKSVESYRSQAEPPKIEIKEIDLSHPLELAYARGGKSHKGTVRYVRDPAVSMEVGISVDELNAIFKAHQDSLQLYFADLTATPWVFEGHEKGVVRAGVTFYLKRLQGIPAAAAAPPAAGKQ